MKLHHIDRADGMRLSRGAVPPLVSHSVVGSQYCSGGDPHHFQTTLWVRIGFLYPTVAALRPDHGQSACWRRSLHRQTLAWFLVPRVGSATEGDPEIENPQHHREARRPAYPTSDAEPNFKLMTMSSSRCRCALPSYRSQSPAIEVHRWPWRSLIPQASRHYRAKIVSCIYLHGL